VGSCGHRANATFTLAFKLHPGKDIEEKYVSIGVVEKPVGLSTKFDAGIVRSGTLHKRSLEEELSEITDFRVATAASRSAAINLGKEYDRAKNSGDNKKVLALFSSVQWKVVGKPTDPVTFRSGSDEKGMLMIVDWRQGSTLDIDAELSQT
jgi:hypothetical protein